MPMPIAFFCRAKPQSCDAFLIFRRARRVFIGYPLMRQDPLTHQEEQYNPQAFCSCLVDPTCSDEEWGKQTKNRNWKKSSKPFTQNRNFIREVEKRRDARGAIVVIPRPNEGAAYLARITGQFEIVDTPTWGYEYLALRQEQGLKADDNEAHHIADVTQGWPLDEYQRIELSRIPGWMRRSLFGRSTYGKFDDHHPLDKNATSYEVLDQILNDSPRVPLTWTLEIDEIKRRLVDTLSNPSAFENLVISLLQLEHPDEMWHHTGGSGDGGIDGFGSNEAGKVVGLMQAKFYAKKAPNLGILGVDGEERIKHYAAVLLPETPSKPTDGTCLLNLDWIASAVRRHWRCLPLATTMRVGKGTD